MNRRHAIVAMGTLLVGGLAGCISTGAARDVSDEIDETIDADVDDLVIETTAGSITVVASDRDDIAVDGEKHAASEADLDALTLEQTIEEGTLSLVADTDDVDTSLFGLQLRPNPKLDLDIEVPQSVSLSAAETVAGTIDIEGVSGPMSVGATAGAVSLSSIDGAVSIEVTAGDIDVDDVDGPVDAEATAGRVSLSTIGDDATVETTTGDVNVHGVDGDLTVETTVGSVSYEAVSGEVATD